MGDFCYARCIPFVILNGQLVVTPASKLHEIEELEKAYERADQAFELYKKRVEEANRNDD